MPKIRLGQDQEAPMSVLTMRIEFVLERWVRKHGGTAYIRQLIRDDMRGFKERRCGAPDRRRRK